MTSFCSEIYGAGIVWFPQFSGIRVMMMPFHVHDPNGSLPPFLAEYRPVVAEMLATIGVEGTGYLTVDEALVVRGETHRRPGLHVDGVGPDGTTGAWGGGGGGWAKRGMLLAASHFGCRGWNQEVEGAPGPDGDCAHLRGALDPARMVLMEAGRVFWCSPLAVHEAVPMAATVGRQLVRVSLPSDAPWFEGYTPSPLGIMPAGPVLPARTAQMGFRA